MAVNGFCHLSNCNVNMLDIHGGEQRENQADRSARHPHICIHSQVEQEWVACVCAYMHACERVGPPPGQNTI